MKNGFTLIELLIVVAIIAILAVIALPNFLEAQARAKVSRTHSDMRTVAAALEAYRIQENHYPPGPMPKMPPFKAVQTWRLTTPISYLSSIPRDLFVPPPGKDFMGGPYGLGGRYLHYLNGENEPLLHEVWLLFSYGPDQDMESDAISYDPTNGTISSGDIYRIGSGARSAD